MPFLFHEQEAHAVAKPKGRRTFNGNGEEIGQEVVRFVTRESDRYPS